MSSAQILAIIGGALVGGAAYSLFNKGVRMEYVFCAIAGLVLGWLAVTA